MAVDRGLFQMSRGLGVPAPSEQDAGQADPQLGQQLCRRQVADGLIVTLLTVVEEGQGRGPDDLVGPKVPCISRSSRYRRRATKCSCRKPLTAGCGYDTVSRAEQPLQCRLLKWARMGRPC